MDKEFDSEILQQLTIMRLELFQAAEILKVRHSSTCLLEFRRMILDIAKFCNIRVIDDK